MWGVEMAQDFTVEVKPATRDSAVTELFLGYHQSLVGLALLLVDDLGTAEDVVRTRSWAYTGAGTGCATRVRRTGTSGPASSTAVDRSCVAAESGGSGRRSPA
jgi:hypothetical protein